MEFRIDFIPEQINDCINSCEYRNSLNSYSQEFKFKKKMIESFLLIN